MTADDVVDFYFNLGDMGIQIWIEGGWGVDALLEVQTRTHPDLDILIAQKDVQQFRKTLEHDGYREIKLDIARPHNFVLGDDGGCEIDVHVITIDDRGYISYGPTENPEVFPPDLLTGQGRILGRKVRCVPAVWQVKWHTGYKLREVDYRDVPALCDRFGIEYPEEYVYLRKDR